MKKLHSFFRNSECLGSWLHRFVIVEEYDTGVMEVCEICKKEKFFKLVDGKADNQQYMNYHIRSALPKNHPYFSHEYEYDPELQEKIVSPYEK